MVNVRMNQNLMGGVKATLLISFCSDVQDSGSDSHFENLQMTSPLEPYVLLNQNL